MRFLTNFRSIDIRGDWNKSGGLENCSKINNQGDDYSVPESTFNEIASKSEELEY